MRGLDFKDLEKYLDVINKPLENGEIDGFLESLVKELGGSLYRNVVKRTPAAEVNGGTLKKGWRVSVVERYGKTFTVFVFNDVPYAIYVEKGHRTRVRKDGTRGWVEGYFMLERAEMDIEKVMHKIVKARYEKFLEGVFK